MNAFPVIAQAGAVVTLLWGIDPILLALAPAVGVWAAIWPARIAKGLASVGSLVLAHSTGVHAYAKPGVDTTRGMAALFLINGLARLIAPSAAASASSHHLLSLRGILLVGGSGVLASSFLFALCDRWPAMTPLSDGPPGSR